MASTSRALEGTWATDGSTEDFGAQAIADTASFEIGDFEAREPYAAGPYGQWGGGELPDVQAYFTGDQQVLSGQVLSETVTPAGDVHDVSGVPASRFSTNFPVGLDDDLTPGGWNPTEDSLRPVRGRHRVAKQRGMARSSAVLGVGMIAAVGAGGMATAKNTSPASLSMPDLASAATSVQEDLPVLGDVLADDSSDDTVLVAQAPLTQAALTTTDAAEGQTDAGEALRARILEQAAAQQSEHEQSVRAEAVAAAADKAKGEAAAQAEKAAAEAAAEAARKAEAERLAKLARSYTLPTSNFRLTESFGAAGDMWAANHTGQDFAAPSGTPVAAVHTGTVKEAGWAGSYGYRIVLQLEDGTELWYCHLSSMQVSVGEKVTTKDVIGNVGSTGNSTGPHLHFEVRPGGGDPIAPLSWLRSKGLSI